MTATVRNLRFDLENDSVPRHWHGGRRSVTSFFDSLSVFFPAGERFFVQSVRAYQNDIKDDALRHEVRTFCAQEGIHGREHERYNDRLKRQGYPVARMEARVEKVLERLSKRAPRELAARRDVRARALHGAHGAPAAREPEAARGRAPRDGRDVALARRRGERAQVPALRRLQGRRRSTIRSAWPRCSARRAIFWAKVVGHQARDDAGGRHAVLGRGVVAPLLKFLFIEPGGMFQLWGMYFEYFRPGFHPIDIDSTALLDAWRAEYAKSPVYAHAAPAAAAE